jgi:hypothetical protein
MDGVSPEDDSWCGCRERKEVVGVWAVGVQKMTTAELD